MRSFLYAVDFVAVLEGSENASELVTLKKSLVSRIALFFEVAGDQHVSVKKFVSSARGVAVSTHVEVSMSFSEALSSLAKRTKDLELFLSETGAQLQNTLSDAPRNSSAAKFAAQNQSASLVMTNGTDATATVNGSNATASGRAGERRQEIVRRKGGRRRAAQDVVLAVTCGQGHTQSGEVCKSCAFGKYKEELDNSTCSDCPRFAVTVRQGSILPAHCICKEGFINVQNVSRGNTLADNVSAAPEILEADLSEAGDSGGELAVLPTCKPEGYVEPGRIVAASNAISISISLVVATQVSSATE